MSTRRLILTALVCGIAILASGVAFFARLVRHRSDLTVDSILAVGQPARVGDAAVTVRSATTSGGQLQLVVTIDRGEAAGTAPLGTSASAAAASARADEPWSLVQGSLRPKVAPAIPATATASSGSAGPCAAATLEPGTTVTCVVAFEPATGPAFAAFEWQGAHGRWRL